MVPLSFYDVWAKKFSFSLKVFFAFLFFNPYLQADYTPASLVGKYQFGLIDWNFYYTIHNLWMSELANYYNGGPPPVAAGGSGLPQFDGLLSLRRAIVPSAMVDWNGDLYTVSLYNWGSNGPIFLLQKCSWSSGTLVVTSLEYTPWTYAYNKDSLSLGNRPIFTRCSEEETWFKWGFHNALQPCIFQEVNASSVYVRVFHYIPNRGLIIGDAYSDLADFEGGLILQLKKSDFTVNVVGKDNRTARGEGSNNFLWSDVLPNWSVVKGLKYPNYIGNFQGFALESSPYYSWLFHTYYTDAYPDGGDNTGASVHCIRYDSYEYNRNGVASIGDIAWLNNNSTIAIYPRFIKVGDYVYCVARVAGYWFQLCRITPNQTTDSSVGTIEERVLKCKTDNRIEISSKDTSIAPYDLDFCFLEPDGTPCSTSSSDSNKILCLFGFCVNGTGRFGTYLNWDYKKEVASFSSYYLGSGAGDPSSSPANTIYVTNCEHANEDCVDTSNTTKSDEYRLYLNTHKFVPYTSPSGRHYFIYAYCYPGKKTHLYLGYAQYTIDESYHVKLLSQTEFKASGNDGWGDSFGSFTDCSRIISMDLKNNHLWITFMKDSAFDANGATLNDRKSVAHYNYFHILASDLIQE